MRPSSLGGGRILRRTLSVCLSVCPSVPLLSDEVFYFTVEPSYERTSKIEKLRFSLMGQRHVCYTFRHALRAAYRTAISAAQILVFFKQISALLWASPYAAGNSLKSENCAEFSMMIFLSIFTNSSFCILSLFCLSQRGVSLSD